MGLDRLELALAVGLTFGFGGSSTAAGPLTNSPNGQRDSIALLERIEREWPVGVKRDAQSNVISVILPVKELTDENVCLLTNVGTLTSLGLSCSRVTKQPSGEAVQSLQHAPSLTALTIQCTGEIPADVFGGLLKMTQLEALAFTGTWPPEGKGYAPLKVLPRLNSLTVYYPGPREDEGISTLAELHQLKHLEIIWAQLDETNYYPLLNNHGLTNLNVVSRTWKLQMRRKGH